MTSYSIDKNEYPFNSKEFSLPAGKMKYVDEGTGEPVVMVHGNPTWSFVYRHLIKCLSSTHRCVAMDHLGFGLSDKPEGFSHRPQEHAKNLEMLLDTLKLENITFIVQDWGGPLGLSYAINHPQKCKRIIILNTWMWSTAGDKSFEGFSKFMGGPIGRFLVNRANLFAGPVMKSSVKNKTSFSKHIHDHYTKVLSSPVERRGSHILPKQIMEANGWLNELWTRSEVLKDIPVLILWGMKDVAFKSKELERWKGLFSNKDVITYQDAGHFIQEDLGEDLCTPIKDFLQK